jgi:hypothetical protein
LRLSEMTHAFSALMRIYLVELHSHGDRIIGAFWLANIAVDAFIGNHQCHDCSAKRYEK